MEGLAGLLKDQGIEIADFTKKHTQTLSVLETIDGHNDPNDFAIISQAITDRYTLISSDRKFKGSISHRILALFITNANLPEKEEKQANQNSCPLYTYWFG